MEFERTSDGRRRRLVEVDPVGADEAGVEVAGDARRQGRVVRGVGRGYRPVEVESETRRRCGAGDDDGRWPSGTVCCFSVTESAREICTV